MRKYQLRSFSGEQRSNVSLCPFKYCLSFRKTWLLSLNHLIIIAQPSGNWLFYMGIVALDTQCAIYYIPSGCFLEQCY